MRLSLAKPRAIQVDSIPSYQSIEAGRSDKFKALKGQAIVTDSAARALCSAQLAKESASFQNLLNTLVP